MSSLQDVETAGVSTYLSYCEATRRPGSLSDGGPVAVAYYGILRAGKWSFLFARRHIAAVSFAGNAHHEEGAHAEGRQTKTTA